MKEFLARISEQQRTIDLLTTENITLQKRINPNKRVYELETILQRYEKKLDKTTMALASVIPVVQSSTDPSMKRCADCLSDLMEALYKKDMQ